MGDYAQRMLRCGDYVEALEEERRKIQVFHRELPLCLELVTQAIDACRQQLKTAGGASAVYFPGRSDSSEQTSSEGGPVLEEFIPLKRSTSLEEEESDHHRPKSKERNDKPLKKIDWLRSVQLWNSDHSDPDPPPKQDQAERKTSVIETKISRGAFHPFQRDNNKTVPATSIGPIPSSGQTAAASSTTTTATNTTISDTEANGGVSVNNEGRGNGKKEEKDGNSQRKPRRSWSPELHRRFLHALQQLGGSHAATPKQIRELMKVDGLTNDEVKSHLQKYRLHTRRPSVGGVPNGNNMQQPQFVVVGGIWVPPPEYAAVGETNGVVAKGIYAPVASPAHPPPATLKQSRVSPADSEEYRGSRSGSGHENGHSNSPTSSSSTHTTTASPPS